MTIFYNVYPYDLDSVKYIRDAGLTEVPEGTLTCIGFKQTENTKRLTKNLRLV
jgi:peptidyl-tRNA hydrolase